MNEEQLILAVPSKGRLEEETRRVFGESRLPIARPGGARSYVGSIKNQPQVSVRFYPAAEIARELIMGAIDIGVTGSDLIHEAAENGEENVVFVKPLDFGQADVVVAVPDAWIDVTQMSDLADVASDFRSRHGRWLRIATKYVHLTRKFFADHGIAEYRIVESAGATEVSPAAGAADLIVDITSSGETLAANALRILEDGLIMKSEANLIVSKGADWTPMKKAQLEALLSIMGGIPPGISTQL
ncbi:MAG: ATP phosphoribosyltransferase [Devosia sp.]|uniref:ATP phosphoribosyltransferase n=1 Tax=Devosia sp. 66-22 TaxID=1895753 RepID=UPI00092865CD|nr:ATP phosphoribosyltransferase [Devosia sp. 66-22]MBN9345798.1 ATP phosphoribosyltransferase [Devosia sp.]OJX51239.1 MAG: ATP phosphoribosyltransferase [Devosia sp. 66-22]